MRDLVVTVANDEVDDPGATDPMDVGGVGDVSLREALTIAINTTGATTITFDTGVFPLAMPTTIFVGAGSGGASLPAIEDDTCIDGRDAGVILDGSSTPATANGLEITGSNNVVAGLSIVNSPDDGIQISVATNNLVRDCDIGVSGPGPGDDGVHVNGGGDNTIGPGVIIGNSATHGVYVFAGAINTMITGKLRRRHAGGTLHSQRPGRHQHQCRQHDDPEQRRRLQQR